jgi:L-amino acid N-acyltransferase YncA
VEAQRARTLVRDSAESDLPAIGQIYAFYVLNSLATFEALMTCVREGKRLPTQGYRTWSPQ